MSYPTFPTLSRKPALRTRTTTIDPTLRDPIENGMASSRARFTRRRRRWSVAIDFLTLADQLLLEEFVQQDAVYGANLFNFFDTRQPTAPELIIDPTSSSVVLPTGSVAFTVVRSLGPNYSAMWSNFLVAPTATPMPADAVIQGIYPVCIAHSIHDQANRYLSYGTGMNLTTVTMGTGFTNPSPPAPSNAFGGTLNFSAEFYGASIGTSLSALTGQQIRVLLDASVDYPFPAHTPLALDDFEVTGCGYAIYYTSATPTTDAAMAPPFAVPGGQGLAWALPFTAAGSGNSGGNFFGIFDPSSGHGIATPTSGSRFTFIPNPQALLVRFEVLPSYTDTGWVATEFRQNCSFEIGEI